MLAAGTICCPTKIEREIRRFDSSASPILVLTDDGFGFVKAPNNPFGKNSVVAELVSAELGTWLGLKIPPFSIIKDCNIELIMKNGQVMEPPLFFSSQVDGYPYDGSDTFLANLSDKDDICRLVVFDTWIRNWDRHFLEHDNKDNLLFVRDQRRYQLVPIDHSWGFDADFPLTVSAAMIEDKTVFGKFPNFDKYIDNSSLTTVLGRLVNIDRKFVEDVVNSVPLEWNLGSNASQTLVNLICSRAEFVVQTIAARLVDDPPILGI